MLNPSFLLWGLYYANLRRANIGNFGLSTVFLLITRKLSVSDSIIEIKVEKH